MFSFHDDLDSDPDFDPDFDPDSDSEIAFFLILFQLQLKMSFNEIYHFFQI